MPKISRFLALDQRDRILLLKAVALVAAVRVAITVSSNRALRSWIARPGEGANTPSVKEIQRVAWAVRKSARFVPSATCLTQALAAQHFLSRANFRSEIRIGVTSDASGRFLAHAWVVSGGLIVVGGTSEEVGRFRLLQRNVPGPR